MSYIWFNGIVLWNDEGDTPNVGFVSETDLNGRTNVIEPLGDTTTNIYRGTKADNKTYSIVMRLGESNRMSLEELLTWWKTTHATFGGLRTLTRKTDLGYVFTMEVVPASCQISFDGGGLATVTQEYEAATPWWKHATEQSVTTAFNAGAPVAVPCTNAGNIETWIRFDINGLVTDPEVSYGADWSVEFLLDLTHIGDLLAVNCRTPASAWYTPNAGAITRAYGYRSETTSFRKAKLPTGTNNLTLLATAGNGAITIYWFNYYEALI